MPKSTHFHQTRDVMGTDKKNRPEDEGIYEQEKQEFQSSEKAKKSEAIFDEGSTSEHKSSKE